MNAILWVIAGADPRLLMRPECAADRAGYSTLGAQVALGAAIDAGVVGMVAKTIGATTPFAFGLAFVWFLWMLLFDMAIMRNARRRDGERFRSVMQRVLPRLVVAVVIGIGMGVALEQVVHRDLVALELERGHLADALALDQQIAARYTDIARLRSQISDFESQIREADNQVVLLRAEALHEADGSGGSRVRGTASIFAAKAAAVAEAGAHARRLRVELGPQVATLRARLDALSAAQERDRSQGQEVARKATGFTSRYLAVRRLEGDDVHIRFLNVLLKLVMVAVTLTPVLIKLSRPRAAYDALADEAETAAITRADARRRLDQETVATEMEAQRHWVSTVPLQLTRILDETVEEILNRSRAVFVDELTPDVERATISRLRSWIRREMPGTHSHFADSDSAEASHRTSRDMAFDVAHGGQNNGL